MTHARMDVPARRRSHWKRPARRLAAAVLGLAAVATAPSPVSAQSEDSADTQEFDAPAARAGAHFKRGVQLYEEGDFDAALVQFRRAHDVLPNYRVLYNIAQTHFQLRRYVEAHQHLQEYVAGAGEELDPERKAAISKDLLELSTRIAELTVTSNIESAEVFVDGEPVGTTPLSSPIRVNEGRRTVSVESSELGTKHRVVELAGGEEISVALEFPQVPVQSAMAERSRGPTTMARSPSPAIEDSGVGAGFWVAFGGTLALGAAAGVTGFLTLQAEEDNQRELDQRGVSQSALNDSKDKTTNLALTTDVLLGATALMAGVTVAVLLSSDEEAQPAVALTLSPNRMELSGSF